MNPQHEAHERMCKAIGDMAKENDALKQRIKRLEEAGDEMAESLGHGLDVESWKLAKEAKL